MPGIKRVVGIGLSGQNVSSTFGKIPVKLISASYADKLEVGTLSMMGAQEIDEVTQSTYALDEVTLKISSVEFRATLMPRMPKNGGGNIRIPIVINFSHPDLGSDSDLLDGCRIINWPAAMENSNSALEVELKAHCRQIFWTHQRKTINALRGPNGIAVPVGAHGF